MNYLTNYYKNLSEQLQEQLNNLENVLLEYRKTKTQHVDIEDIAWDGNDVPLISGTVVTKKGNPAGKGRAKTNPVAFYPGMGAMPNYRGNDEYDAEEAIADWGRPTVEKNPIYANFMGQGPAQEVRRNYISDEGRSRKGGSVKGTGKKAKKKERAIWSAEYDRKHGRHPH